MSPRSSSSGGPYRKPRADVYTWMLLLAFVAIVIACICLYLEVADYGPQPYSLAAPVGSTAPAVACCAPTSPGEPDRPAPSYRANTPIHG